MLFSDTEYVEGMKMRSEELNAEVDSASRAIAFIYERGERYSGEIGKHLSDLDLLKTQAWFAEVAVSLLEESKLPERKIEPIRRSGDITDLMIEQARAYPIDKLLDTKRVRVRCINPDHDDQHPSMDARNGFVFCYSCGFQADPIKVYMMLKDCTFPEAVRALNA